MPAKYCINNPEEAGWMFYQTLLERSCQIILWYLAKISVTLAGEKNSIKKTI